MAKRVVSKGVICSHCGMGIRLLKPNTYVRCVCGLTQMYGDISDPVIVTEGTTEPQTVPFILMVDDSYVKPKNKGGLVIVNKKTGGVFGVPKDVVDMVMPLLGMAKTLGWTDRQLMDACRAMINYDKLIGDSVGER